MTQRDAEGTWPREERPGSEGASERGWSLAGVKRMVPQGREIEGSGSPSPHNVKNQQNKTTSHNRAWEISGQRLCAGFLGRAADGPPGLSHPSTCVCTTLRGPPRLPSPVLVAGPVLSVQVNGLRPQPGLSQQRHLLKDHDATRLEKNGSLGMSCGRSTDKLPFFGVWLQTRGCLAQRGGSNSVPDPNIPFLWFPRDPHTGERSPSLQQLLM